MVGIFFRHTLALIAGQLLLADGRRLEHLLLGLHVPGGKVGVMDGDGGGDTMNDEDICDRTDDDDNTLAVAGLS